MPLNSCSRRQLLNHERCCLSRAYGVASQRLSSKELDAALPLVFVGISPPFRGLLAPTIFRGCHQISRLMGLGQSHGTENGSLWTDLMSMNLGEFLTKGMVWLATAGYAWSVLAYSFSGSNRRWDSVARAVWTLACLSLLVHTLLAFHFYHDWSHSHAYRETARQTAELTGREWGYGLYVNYFFVTAWIADVVWWWRGLDLYRRRSTALASAWQVFLLFMFFNGAVVFAHGATRLMGIFVCAAVLIGLATQWRQRLMQ